MHDTGLANRIHAKGVRVVEIAGWRTRGSSTFSPIGAIHHHTAGSSRGTAPSLTTNIYGRPDVPGPLAQVMQSREVDGRDIAYVIAAGRCNHGGVGDWRGRSGNSLFHGLEVEHTGTGPVLAGRHEISCRILAAMLEAPGSTRDAAWLCQHYEYANPPGRKIDFFNLSPPFANRADGVRARVAQLIGRIPQQEEDDVLTPEQDKKLDAIAVAVVPHYQDAQPPDARFRVQPLVAEAIDGRFATPGTQTRRQIAGDPDNDPKGLIEYALERSEKFTALEENVARILELLEASE